MGCVGSTCRGLGGGYEDIPQLHNTTEVPTMRLCAPGKDCSNFADVGDPVVLYVDFGPYCSPCQLNNVGDTVDGLERVRAAAATHMPSTSHSGQLRYDYEVKIAGVIAKLTCVHPARRDSKCYKASVKIPTEGTLIDGGSIPVVLPYRITFGSRHEEYGEITQDVIENEHAVFFQPIWPELKRHNLNSLSERNIRRGAPNMGRYGSMGRTSAEARPREDQPDGSDEHLSSAEQEERRAEDQRRQRMKPTRYWPDSWQMRCWRKAGCDAIIRSKNPVARFLAFFFVTPLTNVATLSLYYQLYLSEIFHTRFWTRLFHYLCMPFIVLMMLAFFAQWRFVFQIEDSANHIGNITCYKTGNFEVLIANGSMALGLAFWVWYLVWGAFQQTVLMGIFMIVPLFVLYLLSNIYFQLSIKNSSVSYACDECWPYTSYASDHIQYYKIFDLMEWYFNPVIWAVVFSFIQSLSHICEPKLPPRVTQTPHWLSISQTCKRVGLTNFLCISAAMLIFGTVDEFLASPRLLPIFILRVCYELGYHDKQWKWMKKLVKKCQQYGDPALDYIGTGGAEYLSEHSTVFRDNIDNLKSEFKSMELALTDHQKKILESPSLLSEFQRGNILDPFLEHYIILRHYVAQYALQVYAYGPFRLQGDDDNVERDNHRMARDFGENESFMKFLHQVRFSLWEMEDALIERRFGSSCCRDVEEV